MVATVLSGLTDGSIESDSDAIALLGSIERLTTCDHSNDTNSQLVRVEWEV